MSPTVVVLSGSGDGGRWCEQPFTHVLLAPLRRLVQAALSVGVYSCKVDGELSMHGAAEIERRPALRGPHCGVAAVRVARVRVRWWWAVSGGRDYVWQCVSTCGY